MGQGKAMRNWGMKTKTPEAGSVGRVEKREAWQAPSLLLDPGKSRHLMAYVSVIQRVT